MCEFLFFVLSLSCCGLDVTKTVQRDPMAEAVVDNVPVRMQLVSATDSQGNASAFQDGW